MAAACRDGVLRVSRRASHPQRISRCPCVTVLRRSRAKCAPPPPKAVRRVSACAFDPSKRRRRGAGERKCSAAEAAVTPRRQIVTHGAHTRRGVPLVSGIVARRRLSLPNPSSPPPCCKAAVTETLLEAESGRRFHRDVADLARLSCTRAYPTHHPVWMVSCCRSWLAASLCRRA